MAEIQEDIRLSLLDNDEDFERVRALHSAVGESTSRTPILNKPKTDRPTKQTLRIPRLSFRPSTKVSSMAAAYGPEKLLGTNARAKKNRARANRVDSVDLFTVINRRAIFDGCAP